MQRAPASSKRGRQFGCTRSSYPRDTTTLSKQLSAAQKIEFVLSWQSRNLSQREHRELPSSSGLQLSEVKLKPQLQLARTNRGVADLPEAWIVDRSIRRPEYRMVERVLGLKANFEVHRLTDGELLPQR